MNRDKKHNIIQKLFKDNVTEYIVYLIFSILSLSLMLIGAANPGKDYEFGYILSIIISFCIGFQGLYNTNDRKEIRLIPKVTVMSGYLYCIYIAFQDRSYAVLNAIGQAAVFTMVLLSLMCAKLLLPPPKDGEVFDSITKSKYKKTSLGIIAICVILIIANALGIMPSKKADKIAERHRREETHYVTEYNGKYYYTREDLGLYTYDIETRTSDRIKEGNGRLYKLPTGLYFADSDGTTYKIEGSKAIKDSSIIILEDYGISQNVIDDRVYYMNHSGQIKYYDTSLNKHVLYYLPDLGSPMEGEVNAHFGEDYIIIQSQTGTYKLSYEEKELELLTKNIPEYDGVFVGDEYYYHIIYTEPHNSTGGNVAIEKININTKESTLITLPVNEYRYTYTPSELFVTDDGYFFTDNNGDRGLYYYNMITGEVVEICK